MRLRGRVFAALGAVYACAAPASAQGDPAPPPSWLTYDRPATYDSIVEHVEVPVRQSLGGQLDCYLGRPANGSTPAPGRFPGIIWEYTPYGAVLAYKPTGEAPAPEFVTRGYNVLTCDTPGGGQRNRQIENFTPFTDRERAANYDIIEWLATRPYSNGRVAQQGNSYGGMTSYRIPSARPPHLAAVSPADAFRSWYLDWTYPGGTRSGVEPYTIVSSATTLGRGATQTAELLQHPYYDSYYLEKDIWNKLPGTSVPILGLGCWDGFFTDAMAKNYIDTKDRQILVMGPEEHACGTWARLAFYDHYLMGIDVPPPPARVFSYETPTPAERPAANGRGWTMMSDWPPPDARVTRLQMTSDNRLAEQSGPAGSHTYAVNAHDNPYTTGSPGQAIPPATANTAFGGDGVYPDQTSMDAQRLLFTTPPIEIDQELVGPIEVRLRASLTATDGNLVVRVEDVTPEGQSFIVTRGWLKASHRLSHGDPTPLNAGEIYEFDIHVWPHHWRFEKGHRIQLAVSSGDTPKINPDAPPGDVTIFTGDLGSYADLTLRSGPLRQPPSPGWPPAVMPIPKPSLGLPPARRCVSRRNFVIRLRGPRGQRLRSATVYVSGRPVRVLRGRRVRARVDLRGLPKGRVRVRIIAVTRRGERYISSRTYRTCTKRRSRA